VSRIGGGTAVILAWPQSYAASGGRQPL
jgi:hypothetical protein